MSDKKGADKGEWKGFSQEPSGYDDSLTSFNGNSPESKPLVRHFRRFGPDSRNPDANPVKETLAKPGLGTFTPPSSTTKNSDIYKVRIGQEVGGRSNERESKREQKRLRLLTKASVLLSRKETIFNISKDSDLIKIYTDPDEFERKTTEEIENIIKLLENATKKTSLETIDASLEELEQNLNAIQENLALAIKEREQELEKASLRTKKAIDVASTEKINQEKITATVQEQLNKLTQLQPYIIEYNLLSKRFVDLLAQVKSAKELQAIQDVADTLIWLAAPMRHLDTFNGEETKKSLKAFEDSIKRKERELRDIDPATTPKMEKEKEILLRYLPLVASFAELRGRMYSELTDDERAPFESGVLSLQEIEDQMENPTEELLKDYETKLEAYTVDITELLRFKKSVPVVTATTSIPATTTTPSSIASAPATSSSPKVFDFKTAPQLKFVRKQEGDAKDSHWEIKDEDIWRDATDAEVKKSQGVILRGYKALRKHEDELKKKEDRRKPNDISANNIRIDNTTHKVQIKNGDSWEVLQPSRFLQLEPALVTLTKYEVFMDSKLIASTHSTLIAIKNEVIKAIEAGDFALADTHARELGKELAFWTQSRQEERAKNLSHYKAGYVISDDTVDFAFIKKIQGKSLVINRNTGDWAAFEGKNGSVENRDGECVDVAMDAIYRFKQRKVTTPALTAKKNEIITQINEYRFVEARKAAEEFIAYIILLNKSIDVRLTLTKDEKKAIEDFEKENTPTASTTPVTPSSPAAGATPSTPTATASTSSGGTPTTPPPAAGAPASPSSPPTGTPSTPTAAAPSSPVLPPATAPAAVAAAPAMAALRLMDSWPASIREKKTNGDVKKGIKPSVEWIHYGVGGKEMVLDTTKWAALYDNFNDVFSGYKEFFRSATTRDFLSAPLERQRKTVECRDLIDAKNEVLDALISLDADTASALIDTLRTKIFETSEEWEVKMKDEGEKSGKEKAKKEGQKGFIDVVKGGNKKLEEQESLRDEIFPILRSDLERDMLDRRFADLTGMQEMIQLAQDENRLTEDMVNEYATQIETITKILEDLFKKSGAIYSKAILRSPHFKRPSTTQMISYRDEHGDWQKIPVSEWQERHENKKRTESLDRDIRMTSALADLEKQHKGMLYRDVNTYIRMYVGKDWPATVSGEKSFAEIASKRVLGDYRGELVKERDRLIGEREVFEAQLKSTTLAASEKPTQETLDAISARIQFVEEGISLVEGNHPSQKLLKQERTNLLTKTLKSMKSMFSPSMEKKSLLRAEKDSGMALSITKDDAKKAGIPDKKIFNEPIHGRTIITPPVITPPTPSPSTTTPPVLPTSPAPKPPTTPPLPSSPTGGVGTSPNTDHPLDFPSGDYTPPEPSTLPTGLGSSVPGEPTNLTQVDPNIGNITPLEAADKPISPEQLTPETRLERARKAVERLLKIRFERIDSKKLNWKFWIAATTLAAAGSAFSKENNYTIENKLRAPTTAGQAVSWRDFVTTKEQKVFLNDLIGLQELPFISFIQKYSPAFTINKNNLATIAKLSEMTCSELVGPKESVYGIDNESTRMQLCSIVKNLEDTLVSTNYQGKVADFSTLHSHPFIDKNPKLTLEQFYHLVRQEIAAADKKEKRA